MPTMVTYGPTMRCTRGGQLTSLAVDELSSSIEGAKTTYYLCYQINGKRVWDPAGDESSFALVALQRKALALQDAQERDSALTPTHTAPPRCFIEASPRRLCLRIHRRDGRTRVGLRANRKLGFSWREQAKALIERFNSISVLGKWPKNRLSSGKDTDHVAAQRVAVRNAVRDRCLG